MAENDSATIMDEVTCPFCGLCCDDLRLEVNEGRVHRVEKGCGLSQQRFDQANQTSRDITTRVDGEPASLESALDRATEILLEAELPLIGVAGTDVNGMRAALNLADTSGAVLDTMLGEGALRNLRVLQDKGWMTTTLTELRNRADLIIVIGHDTLDRFPRLLERVLLPRKILWKDAWEPMFLNGAQQRQFIMVGPWEPSALHRDLIRRNPTMINVNIERIGEVASALHAILSGTQLQALSLDEADMTLLQDTATRLEKAQYAVIIWCAGELEFPHAELAIESWSELIRTLNITTRCSALAMGASEADATAHQVCTWLSGQPLRTAFLRAGPQHDPYLYDGIRMIENDECDALLWISCFSPSAVPPVTKNSRIVLGHPQMNFDQPPAVHIPTGIPGIDHSGHLYRTDQVVALPLSKLRNTLSPSAAEVIASIERRYRDAGPQPC